MSFTWKQYFSFSIFLFSLSMISAQPVVIDEGGAFCAGTNLSNAGQVSLNTSTHLNMHHNEVLNQFVVLGYTNNAITTPTAYDPNPPASDGTMISKFDESGNILASTYFPIDVSTETWKVKIGDDGKVYLFGHSRESTGPLPTTANAFQNAINGVDDYYLAIFDANLSSLLYASFYGGDGLVGGQPAGTRWRSDFILHSNGLIYVTGSERSAGVATIPMTSSGYDTSQDSGAASRDAFIWAIDPNTGDLVYGTFFNDDNGGQQYASKLTEDNTGNIIMAGWHTNLSDNTSEIPLTPDAHDNTLSSFQGVNGGTGFITKFTTDLENLLYSSYLGDVVFGAFQASQDPLPNAYITDLFVNDQNEVVIFGTREQAFSANDFTGPCDIPDLNSFLQGSEFWLLQIDFGVGIVNCGNWGASEDDSDIDILYDVTEMDCGWYAMVGRSRSGTGADFPTSSDAYISSSDDADIVVNIVDENGALIYSSYIGTVFDGANEPANAPIPNFSIFDFEDEIFIFGTEFSTGEFLNTRADDISLSTDCEGFYLNLDICPEYSQTELSPASQTTCTGGDAEIIFGAGLEFDPTVDVFLGTNPTPISYTQPSISYEWQESPDGVNNWTTINGETQEFLELENVQSATYVRRVYYADCCDPSISTVVEVLVRPEVAPVVDPGGPYYTCPGVAIPLDINITNLAGPFSYSWSPSTGLSSTTIEDPTASPMEPTQYEVTVSDQATGCETTENVSVIVVVADAGGDNVRLCDDNIGVRIGMLPIAEQPGITYSWSPTAGLDDPTISQPIANPNTTTTYTLTVTLPNGCTTTDQITVDPEPLVADTGGDIYVCQGDDVLIGTPGQTGISYGWAPGLYINSQTSPQTTFFSGVVPETNPYPYTLTAFDIVSGCSKTDEMLAHVICVDAGESYCGPRYLGTPDCTGGQATYSWTVLSGDANSFVSASNIPMPYVDPDPDIETVYQVSVTWGPTTCTDVVTVPDCGCLVPPIFATQNQSCISGTAGTVLRPVWASSYEGYEHYDIDDYSFTWTPTTNLSCSNCFMPTLVNDLTSDITYSLTAINNLTGEEDVCYEDVTVFNSSASLPVAYAKSSFFCEGGAGTNIGAPEVTGWSYLWEPADGLSSATSSDPVASPMESTTYTLRVTDDVSGCTADTTVSVTVVPSATESSLDYQTCPNVPILVGTPAVDGYTYSWSPTSGLSDPNIAQPTATISSATSYVRTITGLESGCSTTQNVNINVLGDIIVEAPDALLCEGGSVVIGPTESYPPDYTFSWLPTIGLSDPSAQQPTVSGINSNTTYTITVSDPSGQCTGTDDVLVSLSSPDADAGPDAVYCNSAVQIGTAALPGYTYSWSPTASLNNPNIAQPLASPSSTTTYTVIATSPDGCSASDEVEVVVTGGADAGPDRVVCSEQCVVIGTPAEPGATYSWSPATGLSSTNMAQVIACPLVTTTYTLTVMNNGCTNTDQVTVTVKSIGDVPQAESVNICQGGCGEIGIEEEPGFTYSWSPTDGLSDPNSATTLACPEETTEYTLTVTDPEIGCSDIQSITVFVSDTPAPEVDLGPDLEICPGDSRQIGIPNVAGYQYTWEPALFLDNPFISNPTSTPLFDISYTLFVVDPATNCIGGDDIAITILDPVDLGDGENPTVCQGSGGGGSVLIGKELPSGYTFEWFPEEGLDNPNSSITVATVTEETTYQLIVTDLDGCLQSLVYNITLSNDPPPDVEAGEDRTVCLGSSSQLGSSATSGLTYTWFGPTEFLNSSTVSNPVFNQFGNAPIGDYYYVVEVFDGVCYNSDNVLVKVRDSETAEAGQDITVQCDPPGSASIPSSVQLMATQPSFGAGMWTQLGGPTTLTISDNTLFNTTVSGLEVGVYTLRWTLGDDATCFENFDDVTITVDNSCLDCDQPSPPVISSIANVCPSTEGRWSIDEDCGPLSSIEFSIDGGVNWTNVLPDWSDGVTLLARCRDDDPNCPSAIDEAVAIAIPCDDPCELTDAGKTNEMCNSNGTSLDESDDYITFTLNPTGTNTSTYSVSVNNGGTVTLANGNSPTGLSYGTPMDFRLQNGSANGTIFTITIVDDMDSDCNITITVQQDPCDVDCPANEQTICDNGSETVELTAEPGYVNYVWYEYDDVTMKKGVEVGTGQTITITGTDIGPAGSRKCYIYEADGLDGCPNNSCCPICISTKTCCPDNNCFGVKVEVRPRN